MFLAQIVYACVVYHDFIAHLPQLLRVPRMALPSDRIEPRIMENIIRRTLIYELLPTRLWPVLDIPNLVSITLDFDRCVAVNVLLPSGRCRTQIVDGPLVTEAEIRGISEHSRMSDWWSTGRYSTVSGSIVRMHRIVTYGETSGLTIHVD